MANKINLNSAPDAHARVGICVIITLCAFLLSACNDRVLSVSFNADNPNNQVSTKITNIANGYGSLPQSLKFDNSAVLNASSLIEADDDKINSDFIISDKDTDTWNLWIYDGKKLQQQTGGINQPPSVVKIYGKPTHTSLVIQSEINAKSVFQDPVEDLWTYDGKSWTRQTGDINQPPSVANVYGKATINSIVLMNKVDSGGLFKSTHFDLWTYDGKSWTLQIGGSNQPPSVKDIFGSPTSKSVVMNDEDNELWVYDRNIWNKLSGGVGQPSTVKQIFGHYPDTKFMVIKDADSKLWIYSGKSWTKFPSFGKERPAIDNVYANPSAELLIVKDSDSNLWVYNKNSWSKYSGGNGQPNKVDTVVGTPTLNSIVLKDGDAKLWVYNGKSWTSLSGGENQPPSVDKIFGNPSESSIVLQDNNDKNLWVYNGTVWSQQTGKSNQPGPIDVLFMVHMRKLQQ